MPSLAEMQRAFTQRIRQQGRPPLPDQVASDRMQVYESLIYHNLDELLGNAFPVIYSILDQVQWQALVTGFLMHHGSQTPFFYEVPEEFIAYLLTLEQGEYPGYLPELAHYEWVELALDLSPEVLDFSEINHQESLATAVLRLSPLAWPLVYQYPVHQIGPDYRSDKLSETPVHLLVYRNRQNTVEFMEIDAFTTRLLALIGSDELLTGQDCCRQLAKEMENPNLNDRVFEILQTLRDNDILFIHRSARHPCG